MNAAQTQLNLPEGVQDTLRKLSDELGALLRGLPYLFARSSYAGEMTLHFGEERQYKTGKLRGKIRGTHVVSLRGSVWNLYSEPAQSLVGCVFPEAIDPSGLRPYNATALESGALIEQGATVDVVRSMLVAPKFAIGLAILFSDGSYFTILPTPPDKSDSDSLPEPADWEVWTMDRVISVGPGLGYSEESFGS